MQDLFVTNHSLGPQGLSCRRWRRWCWDSDWKESTSKTPNRCSWRTGRSTWYRRQRL